MSEHDRITPYNERCTIEDRIDEIVRSGDVHLEMMDGGTAWMRIDRDIFWLHAEKKGKLVVRYSETWPEPNKDTSHDG